MVLNQHPHLKRPYLAAKPVGVSSPLCLTTPTTTTGVAHVVSGTTVAVLAIGAEVVRALSRTATVASHVCHLPYISTLTGTANGGALVLKSGGTTGLSSLDESDRTICYL